ncbi:3-beta hydroxysteroid dehydrogenase/isomerase family protein isoform X2 [Tasmannia lanceolata]|uniref:3-beta hydroxysteroid dehydrogenase/isomerase family protein isoform X2 n=1 Tax=Tasmannia lanceolata TaxID=3420 RepID=UPI0040642C34
MEIDEDSQEQNPRICVVLGGRSFVGRFLVLSLLKSENWIVRISDSASSLILDSHEHNSILSESLLTGQASYFQVDIRVESQITAAIKGSSVVFHMDALDSHARDFYLRYMLTVQGTKNVISACRECKVKKLIYNSSADVVFDGIHDVHNGDESLPYPWRFVDMLSDLKAQAEALVLFANGSGGLLTCALRPSNTFGPGDTHLVPFLVGEAKSGRAKFIIGNGENMCDFTYAENVAHAHICAEKALGSGVAPVAGKAFFITNLEPMSIWEFFSLILEGLGYQRPKIHLPTRLVLFIAVLLDRVHKKLALHRNGLPRLNTAMVRLLSCRRTFSCSNAQKHLGYSPIVSLEAGVASTIESFSHLAENSPYLRDRDFSQPSKVDKLLGSGRVAEILLWRDEKETFMHLLTLAFLFYWFFLSGRTFISSTAKLLLLVTIIVFGHGFFPSSMFGSSIGKISSSYFQVSKTAMQDACLSLQSAWNRGVVHTFRTLAQGEDWNVLIKVAGSLYFLKLLLSFSLSMVIGIALVFTFAAFFVYEQYEEKFDRLMKAAEIGVEKSKEILIRNLPLFLVSFLHNDQIHTQDNGSSQKLWWLDPHQ